MRSLAFALALLSPSYAFADDPPKVEPPKAEAPKWDVNAPPGPTREAPIDVAEGTWMCLDVAPDGKTLVFDLLGDIYELPIEGGEAKALTSGMAWDMQPRVSPDGAQIAFTSDRAGGDNLWVMKRDGSEPKQITKESFRLVSSPCWTVDGQALVGRKHFTSHRSLGAGEMWLWNLAGGDGLQLTTKPTEEKDVGECVYSPDGAYLWYSLDATGGPSFQYNKDSNAGIYAIQRLDLVKGETETIVSGPGGACRPTPSPDGKTLAFIRRVRFKTTLQLLDIASGAVRMVADDLERDHQETWAIFGTYPTIDWMPDAKELVYWARGKLWRQDVASLAKREIPFHVKGSRTEQPAVRQKHLVAPDTFDVKMLRTVRVSPKGDAVVYQALGHLWIRALPDGTPKRLTTQAKDFEFYPSWSRDGSKVAYVSWNDDTLGVVRVIGANGGAEGAAITREPGHYADPTFTPDGKRVVYGKRSGGYLTAPTWSNEPGLYVVDASGGTPALVTKVGTNPQFGVASDRVYLRTDEESNAGDKHTLLSVDLEGHESRTHATSENATEFAVSPDGKWLAFRERFNVYITPFTQTGRAFQVAPKMTSQPVARASKDSGENLQWSGDSTTLYWSLGPELFERKLSDAFAFIAGAPEKLPEPPATGRNISFQAQEAKPSGHLMFINARIVTMKGDEVIENGTIDVEGNRIIAVRESSSTDGSLSNSTFVFDMKGKTITPGFIDVHAHGAQSEDGLTPQRNWVQHANLAFGVTTIHDPSNDTNAIFASSELQKTGMITAPRTFSTGTIIYGAAGSERAEIDSLDDARWHLRRMKAVGAFSVKSYNQPRREQRQQILAAARELDMLVVPEGGSTFAHNLTMVVDGHTGIEHTLSVEKIYSDVTQLWKGSGVGLTPTLIVGYGGIWGENYWYAKTNVWENERLMHFVPRFIVDPRSRRRFTAPDEEWNHFNCARISKALVDVGEHVQLGAHGQLAGLGAHWELWMLGQGGLTPMQALRAATLDGARYLGLDDDIGSIEPGKLADFLVFDKNPLDDLANTASLARTIQNGWMYDAHTMRRESIGDSGAGVAPKFFFDNGLAPAKPGHVHSTGCTCDSELEAQEGPSGYR